jgi:hydroxyacylglutathione hydrolase
MSLEIVTMPLGIANTNAYIIGDNDAKQAVVVDPVDRADLILIAAGTRGWQIRLILATHGHFDHVLASRDLKAATNAVFAAHKDTKPWLDMLPQQGTLFGLGEFSPAGELDELLDDDAPARGSTDPARPSA